MGEMGVEALSVRLAKEMRAAFQEGHDRGYDRRQNRDAPQGQLDWRSSRARVRRTELETEVAALEERLRVAEDELLGLEHVQCAYCRTWAHVDDVTDECGKPYCVDCYESWPWECETPGCSWRCAAPDENGDVCPECGGRFVPMSEKVLPQRAQSAQRENGE